MPEVMTLKQAAEYLQLHPETLKEKARQSLIPASKVGNRWRFLKVDLDDWLRSGGSRGREQRRMEY